MKYSLNIRILREKMFLTQEELASYLGVSFSSVNRWERGHYEPTMKVKRKLNKLFNEYGVMEE